MALANNQYDLSELAKVDENGFQAALFPQIKDAYVKRMQEIYGYDIDVSSASADGQFIMSEALVLNNVYRVLESLSDNLTPASASGKYLDILASLSGAFRKQATYSTATVLVKNSGTTTVTPSYLMFMDKNGNRWQWINPKDITGALKITFAAGAVTAITVTCIELGAISALGGKSDPEWSKAPLERGGDIYATTTANALQVYQKDDATVGQDTESDASLRSRRLRSLGQSGRTVTDTLVANLLNVPGVLDAWVYSNNTSAASTALADGTVVPAHSVYVCVAPQHGVTVPDYNVADTIYGTMTPGIPTYAATNYTISQIVTGTKKEVEIPVTNSISNSVVWKACAEISPQINITFTLKNGVTAFTDAQKKAIETAAFEYMNNIELGQPFDVSVLQQLVEGADFRTGRYGLSTYAVTGVTKGSMASGTSIAHKQLNVPLARFYYSSCTWVPSGGSVTMMFGSQNYPEV